MGQKHRQAKDREKKLEKIEESRIERPRDAKRIGLRIRSGNPSGKRALSLRGLTVGFDRPLLRCPDIELYRGERVAIIGPNGCGKTSLLKTILGELAPLAGRIELGHGVRPAVYRQNQEGLHGDGTVLDAILSRSALTISEARGLLGAFLFSGDDVEKKTKGLSGGERSRVALALLSLIEGHLLMLDEPTNHLDLASQEILEQALLDYDGTVLLVSHDRALLEAVTTQVWLVEGDRLVPHTYSYTEYHRRLEEARVRGVRLEETRQLPLPSSAPRPPDSRPAKKLDKYALKRLEEVRVALEASIEALETRLADIERALAAASATGDTGAIGSLGADHKAVSAELQLKYVEWEALPSEPE
jgi:ATP-binding cassette subfamily F protein 3